MGLLGERFVAHFVDMNRDAFEKVVEVPRDIVSDHSAKGAFGFEDVLTGKNPAHRVHN